MVGVRAFLYLLDEAFEGRGIEESNESQALLTNLATVTEAEWTALPAGATRHIESMVRHVAGCKVMYADYAFGRGTKQWGTRKSKARGRTARRRWPRRSPGCARRIGPSDRASSA